MDNFTVLNQQARCDCCRDVADRVIAYTDSEYVNHICPSCVKDWAQALKPATIDPGPDVILTGHDPVTGESWVALKTCEKPE